MTLRVVYRKAAKAELDEAILYYERQRTGVGEERLSEIDQAVMRAAAHPEHFPVVFDNIRRALAKRFPYTVFSGCAAQRWWCWRSCTGAVTRRFGSDARQAEKVPDQCLKQNPPANPRQRPDCCKRCATDAPGARRACSCRKGNAGKGGMVRSEVARARMASGFTQQKFASLLGVSRRTLQEWEQGRKNPSGAARTLLKIAGTNPKALLAVADD